VTRNATLSRRTALAGAALLVGDLTSSAAGAGERGEDIASCCGNGPPQLRMYGTGIHPTLTDCCGTTVSFANPFWGDQGLLGQYYYVFCPDPTVKATRYVDKDGVSHKPKHYIVADYSGIIYRIQPGYTLDLEWPAGTIPDFSTRPLGRKEGGNP
jgi:hypothetical protein